MQRWMSKVWVEEDIGLGRGGKAVLKQPVLHKLGVWEQEMSNREWALLGTEALLPWQGRRGAGPTQESPAPRLETLLISPCCVWCVRRWTPAGWTPCCFTDLWDNFLTSEFQPLMGICSADVKLIHSEFKPTKFFFSPLKNLFKANLQTARGTTDHRVETTRYAQEEFSLQSQLHLLMWIPCTNNFESHEKLASETMVPRKRFSLCFSKSVTRIHKIFILSQLNKWYLNVFKDLKLISPLCIEQEKKAWKCFPTNKLRIQKQAILNNAYWEWFLSFWSSTANKATVRNLTQIEIKTTHSAWKIVRFRQQG